MLKNKTIFLLFFYTFSSYAFSQDFSKDDIQSNYLLGYQEGQDLQEQFYAISYPSFEQGMTDGYANQIPDAIEEKRSSTTDQYVNWLFNKKTSTFSPSALDSKTIDSFSYFIGSDYGKDFRQKFFTLDAKSFTQGLKDAMEKKPSSTPSSDRSILEGFYSQAEHIKLETQNNSSMQLIQGNELNRTLSKGITYALLQPGTEALHPTPQSQITIEYSLSLLDQKNNIVNLVRQRKVSIHIKDLAEGSKIAILNMQKGEHSLFNIPTSLLFTDTQDWLLSRTLLNITLLSIDSFPSLKAVPLKELPQIMGKTSLFSGRVYPKSKKKKQKISKPSSSLNK